MTLQHLRSSTAHKRPDPTAMADGQIALNTAATSPGLFYKDSAGNLVKAGPVHVGSTAPNASPASGGTAGNSTGEAWLDTSGSNPLLKIWNGSSWQTVQPVASGTVVSTADTGSVTSTMIADGTIVDGDINASAGISYSKLASLTAGNLIVGNASNVPTSTAITGDVTISSSGVTAIGSGVIVDADVNASAAIAGSKIQAASTSNAGAVQLTDSTSSTSTTTAATPNAVKSAYDLANAALPKAGGALTGDVTLNAQSDLRFADADSSNWVAFQGPATVSSNVTWTLPSADGTSGQVLSTNGSGTLSWATASGGSSVTTSDTPPATPNDGDLWYDSVGGRTYVYYQDPNGSQWVDASPQGGGGTSLWTQGTGVLIPATSTDLVQVNGIKFPATQVASADANTLDDYEEGTWTPTFGNLTVPTSTARYTKVGRFVHCQINFTPSDAGTWAAQNYFTISSLPFVPSSFDGMGTCIFSMGASQQAHFMGSGGTTFYFVCTATAGGVNKNVFAPLFLTYSV